MSKSLNTPGAEKGGELGPTLRVIADGLVSRAEEMPRASDAARLLREAASWYYLTDVLRDAGKFRVVAPGRKREASAYQVFGEKPPAEEEPPEPEPVASVPVNVPAPTAAAVLASPFRLKPRRKAPAFTAPERNVRLKPVGADVTRWCSFYLAAGVGLDFLAFCFDVDEDQLAQACAA